MRLAAGPGLTLAESGRPAAVWFTRAVTMSDGAGSSAPADDVDHEVFAHLNRFKVSENLVINVLERERCGLAGLDPLLRSGRQGRQEPLPGLRHTPRWHSAPNAAALIAQGELVLTPSWVRVRVERGHPPFRLGPIA
jgi:hypothetical protein